MFRPGMVTQDQAADLNQLMDMVQQFRQMRSEPPITVNWINGNCPMIRSIPEWDVPVSINSFDVVDINSGLASGALPASGGYPWYSGQIIYSWVEQTFDTNGQRFDKIPGLSGNINYNPLYETNNQQISLLSGNVLAYGRRRGCANALGAAWEFDGVASGIGGSSGSCGSLLSVQGYDIANGITGPFPATLLEIYPAVASYMSGFSGTLITTQIDSASFGKPGIVNAGSGIQTLGGDEPKIMRFVGTSDLTLLQNMGPGVDPKSGATLGHIFADYITSESAVNIAGFIGPGFDVVSLQVLPTQIGGLPFGAIRVLGDLDGFGSRNAVIQIQDTDGSIQNGATAIVSILDGDGIHTHSLKFVGGVFISDTITP